jgi:stage III sporulation protein SpoIIIAA
MEAYELMAVLEDVEDILEPISESAASKEDVLIAVNKALELIGQATEEYEVEEEDEEEDEEETGDEVEEEFGEEEDGEEE